jgi:hypothetical protein
MPSSFNTAGQSKYKTRSTVCASPPITPSTSYTSEPLHPYLIYIHIHATPTAMPKGSTDGDILVRQGNIKYLQHGVYNIAYDPTTPVSSGTRPSNHGNAPVGTYVVRLLRGVFQIAPQLLVCHFLCILWKSAGPALNIYLSASLLDIVRSRSSLLVISGLMCILTRSMVAWRVA